MYRSPIADTSRLLSQVCAFAWEQHRASPRSCSRDRARAVAFLRETSVGRRREVNQYNLKSGNIEPQVRDFLGAFLQYAKHLRAADSRSFFKRHPFSLPIEQRKHIDAVAGMEVTHVSPDQLFLQTIQ